MSQKTKSPIKSPPLREPGQWLYEQMQDILEEKVLAYAIPVFLIVLLAGLEWLRMFFNATPSLMTSIILSVLAIITVYWYVWYICKKWHQYKNIRLGRDGEIAVGQYLEETLAVHGYHVLHDIPGDGFNLDHVIIGPTGIFCIETKTRSKPLKGEHSVQYDGERVTVNGFKPERDPIVQAKAEARWLREFLNSFTGKQFIVRPIVVYPGWFVERMPANVEVWVLNEKSVPTFVRNALNTLSPEDVSLIYSHLKQHVASPRPA